MDIHIIAAGCVNACRHCSVNGKPPYGSFFSLDELRELAKVWGTVYPYFEVTAHPEFPEIMSPDIAGGCGGVLPTTGFGLARRDDATAALKRLMEFGYNTLSFTMHGLADHHDWFVARKGAFQDIVIASSRAAAVGMIIHWNVFIDKWNLEQIPELLVLGKREFDAGFWLDVPLHRVSDKLWRYEKLRPDARGIRRLLTHIDSFPWNGLFKQHSLDELTERAWLQRWREQPDADEFRIPYEPRTWPVGDYFDSVKLEINRHRQIFIDPMCGAPILLGTVAEQKNAIIQRLQSVQAPPHHDLSPDSASLPSEDSELVHPVGCSVRYKAISAAIFGSKEHQH